MSRGLWWTRLAAALAAVAFVGIAFAIRATADGALEQHSGTALYASVIYAGVLFLWPLVSPLSAGAVAIGFCWLVEFAQLTGVPAALSQHSQLARLALGAQFDPTDLAWYPVGVIPLVATHWLLHQQSRPKS